MNETDRSIEEMCRMMGLDPDEVNQRLKGSQKKLTPTQELGLKLMKLGKQYSNQQS